jgi:hypothetical protein
VPSGGGGGGGGDPGDGGGAGEQDAAAQQPSAWEHTDPRVRALDESLCIRASALLAASKLRGPPSPWVEAASFSGYMGWHCHPKQCLGVE